MNAQELLIQPVVFLAPAHALEGLSAAHADKRVNGVDHTIAEIVAHMSFWQDWFRQRCDGLPAPIAAKAADGWPDVTPGSWEEVRHTFLSGLKQLAALGENHARLDSLITPAIEFPPLAHYTRRDVLVHAGQHNAHHLGQIITLRQVLGQWPPPSGSYTW
jgi:uncharacterized damage-inducible protein DinB